MFTMSKQKGNMNLLINGNDNDKVFEEQPEGLIEKKNT